MPPIGVRPGQADKPPSRAPSVGGGLAGLGHLAHSIARASAPAPSVGGGLTHLGHLAHSIARSSGPSVGPGLSSVASPAATPNHSAYRPSLPSVGAGLSPPAGTRLWGIGRLSLSGQVKAIHDLLSKGGYVQYGSATGQDPWKLLYKDSNSYDRSLLSSIRRNVTYAQALRNFTQQGLTPEQAQPSAEAKADPSFKGDVPFGLQRSTLLGGNRSFT